MLEEELDALKKLMQSKERKNGTLKEDLSDVKEQLKVKADAFEGHEKTIVTLIEDKDNKERLIAVKERELTKCQADYEATKTKIDIKTT